VDKGKTKKKSERKAAKALPLKKEGPLASRHVFNFIHKGKSLKLLKIKQT